MNGYDNYQSRTAGQSNVPIKSIQAWKTPKVTQNAQDSAHSTAKKDILAGLEKVAKGHFDLELRTARAYAPTSNHETQQANNQSNKYSFSDVVDIVNPLHHLPLVGMAYRGITGDDIHPMSQVIGGALYGGPIGAVTGTANAISKVQTGKDLGDHVLHASGIKSSNNLANVNSKNDINEEIKLYDKRTVATRDIKQSIETYERTMAFAAIEKDIDELTLPNAGILVQAPPVTHLTLSKMPPRQRS
jgi:hypothetical protein